MRYISETKLKGVRMALAPLLFKPLSGLPEQAMLRLAQLLNGKDSPIKYHAAASASSSSSASGAASSSAGGGAAAAGGFNFGSFFGGGSKNGQGSASGSSASGRGAAGSSSGRGSAPIVASVDYYAVLGVSASATADDIKAAFRKAARTMHPDTQVRRLTARLALFTDCALYAHACTAVNYAEVVAATL